MLNRRQFGLAILATAALPAIPSYALPKDDIVALIDASHQTGYALTTWPAKRPLTAGDIVTVDGVFAVNLVTGKNTEYLRQFVITAPSEIGFRVHHIYPMILNFYDNRGNRPTVFGLPKANASVRLAHKQ